MIIDNTLYTSGVLGNDVKTGQLVKGGIVPESVQVFGNIVGGIVPGCEQASCPGWDCTRA